MPVSIGVGPLARNPIFIAYNTTAARLIAMWVRAIFFTGGAPLIEEQVNESWYRRAEGADEAAHHAEKRDGGPRISRGARETNQIADQGKNPKADRKDNQHGVNGMLKDAGRSTH